MPANAVKTQRDERLWTEAKKQAKKQGHNKDYAYIMGIYQRMKGNKSMSKAAIASVESLRIVTDLMKGVEYFIVNAIPLDELGKAAGHKYIKRIPTGQPRPRYRYIYYAPKTKSLVSSEDVHSGAKFKARHKGQMGHFEVLSHDKDDKHVVVHHDESGEHIRIHEDDFHKMINSAHGQKEGLQERRQARKQGAEAQKRKQAKASKEQARKQASDEARKQGSKEAKQGRARERAAEGLSSLKTPDTAAGATAAAKRTQEKVTGSQQAAARGKGAEGLSKLEAPDAAAGATQGAKATRRKITAKTKKQFKVKDRKGKPLSKDSAEVKMKAKELSDKIGQVLKDIKSKKIGVHDDDHGHLQEKFEALSNMIGEAAKNGDRDTMDMATEYAKEYMKDLTDAQASHLKTISKQEAPKKKVDYTKNPDWNAIGQAHTDARPVLSLDEKKRKDIGQAINAVKAQIDGVDPYQDPEKFKGKVLSAIKSGARYITDETTAEFKRALKLVKTSTESQDKAYVKLYEESAGKLKNANNIKDAAEAFSQAVVGHVSIYQIARSMKKESAKKAEGKPVNVINVADKTGAEIQAAIKENRTAHNKFETLANTHDETFDNPKINSAFADVRYDHRKAMNYSTYFRDNPKSSVAVSEYTKLQNKADKSTEKLIKLLTAHKKTKGLNESASRKIDIILGQIKNDFTKTYNTFEKPVLKSFDDRLAEALEKGHFTPGLDSHNQGRDRFHKALSAFMVLGGRSPHIDQDAVTRKQQAAANRTFDPAGDDGNGGIGASGDSQPTQQTPFGQFLQVVENDQVIVEPDYMGRVMAVGRPVRRA